MTIFDDCCFCAALKVLEVKCRVHQTPFKLYSIALPPTVGYLNVCKKDIKHNKLQQHSHKNRNFTKQELQQRDTHVIIFSYHTCTSFY